MNILQDFPTEQTTLTRHTCVLYVPSVKWRCVSQQLPQADSHFESFPAHTTLQSHIGHGTGQSQEETDTRQEKFGLGWLVSLSIL